MAYPVHLSLTITIPSILGKPYKSDSRYLIPHISVYSGGGRARWGIEMKLFLWCNSPYWTKVSSLSRLHDHTQTHNTLWASSGRLISPKNRPLPHNTQHSQTKDMHAPARFEPENLTSERLQFHALDRAFNGIVRKWYLLLIINIIIKRILLSRYAFCE